MVGRGNGGFDDIQSTNGDLADWVWVVLARVDVVSWLMRHRYEAGSISTWRDSGMTWQMTRSLPSSCHGSVGFI